MNNFFEDYFRAYQSTYASKDNAKLEIALRKKEFEQNLNEMWEIYRKGNTRQIVEYQKGVAQIKDAGFKVFRNSQGVHKIVIP